MRPHWWAAIGIALAASACVTPGSECSYDDSDALEFTVSDAPHAAAFELHTDPGDGDAQGIHLFLEFSNPTDHDCMVAIYSSAVAPDPAGVPDLAVGQVPPESLPTIGARQGFFNLARTYRSADGDRLSTNMGSGGRSATSVFATVITCAEGGITGSAYFSATTCNAEMIAPGESWTGNAALTIARLW